MELYKPLSLIRVVPRGKASVGFAGKPGDGALPAGAGIAEGTTSRGTERHTACLRKTRLEFVLRRRISREMRHILSV